MTRAPNDSDDVASILPDAAGPAGTGPGRYFDQVVFDLHFVLQAARARRLATEKHQPFTVDREGRVTVRTCD